MIKRFFKKSKNIETLEDKEVKEFLVKEKIMGKVDTGRVMDFYNMLSSLAVGEEVEQEETIDYDYFKADNIEKRQVIDRVRDMEKQWARSLVKKMMKGDRLLKTAAVLSYEFEKSMYGGIAKEPPKDINQTLENLFRYSEEKEIEDKPEFFGEMLGLDCRFMNYIALLSNKKAFAKSGDKLERDTQGIVSKYTLMESFDEISNMDMVQTIMPDFNRKLAAKDVQVKARFRKIKKAQNLVIIIDDSGSMSNSEKMAMLKAILMLKLANADDNHNIYISMFETRTKGFIKVNNKMKFDDIDFIRLGGGGTDVNGSIMETIDMIKKRSLKRWRGGNLPLSDDHFEIMVINDGQDEVDGRYHPQIKTHALCLCQSNKDLKNLCHRSGGTYHHLTPIT